MKLSCLQENLHRGLEIIRPAIVNRSTLPIIQSALLKSDQGMLMLQGTNLEMTITTRIGAMIEEEGSATVPYQLMRDLVRSLGPDRVDLDIGRHDDDEIDDGAPASGMAAGDVMRVRCGRSVTNINTADPKDFPRTPEVPDEMVIKIDSAVFRDAVGMVAPSAAADENRPVLTSVHMKLEGKRLEMAAADGFRLSVYRCDLDTEAPAPVEVNIPARAMNVVQQLAGHQSRPVNIAMSAEPQTVRFDLEDVTLTSQLILGAFPNYEQLIPDDYKTRVVMNNEDFRRAIKLADVIAKDGGNIIRLEATLNPDEVTAVMKVSAQTDQIGLQQSELNIDAMEGESNRIAFNSKYLQKLIEVAGSKDVTMEMNTHSAPGVFRVGEMEEFVHVVMPMYVQW